MTDAVQEPLLPDFNAVEIAVKRLGGPTKVSNLLNVSNATIHCWVKKGRVLNYEKAKVVARESKVELSKLLGAE